MNFDAIATAAPLNRDASVVRDGSGDLWEAKIPATQPRWMAPPAMKKLSSLSRPARQLAKELIGQRFGRMVVLGILTESNPKRCATWVCRCDCGYYEGRKAKALRNPDYEPRCFECHVVDRLRERGRSNNTGEARKASEAMLDALAQNKGRAA